MFGVQRIGRYEVLNHLASGGMGQVYLARTTGLGGFERQVVVKTLDLSITDDDDAFVTMFLDEARLVGALHHQYIAPVYEVGCDEEGRYYLVMDYVHGETAEAVMRVASERSQRVPLAFSLTVASCVASALDYAHSLCAADGTPLDIVHRDVSLSNVMCGHDGAVKLIDFGIAKAANRATKTQVGTLKGKIGYLAPEQIHRRGVDHRADIFALGIVLYELTTGERAFRESSDLLTLERITKGEVRRPRDIVADYPAELEAIVMKALEVDPDKRFQDAAAMGRAIEKLAARMHVSLGHAAVVQVMSRLFADRRGRRRIARGSNEVKTDPSIQATPGYIESEKTPVTDVLGTGDVDTRTVTVDERFSVRLKQPAGSGLSRAQRPTIPEPSRAQRPTLPIKEGARSQRPTVPARDRIPIEDRPTPIADPAAALRAQHALIPLEDRPTPIAEALRNGVVAEVASSVDSAGTITTADPPDKISALDLPPPPAPPAPSDRPRIPTGPQLPVDLALGSDTDMQDAPTVISGMTEPDDQPDDPTDLPTDVKVDSSAPVVMTALANPPPPPQAVYVRERALTTSVVAKLRQLKDPTPRTWLVMCGMFVLAVVVACLVAFL